MSSKLNNYPPLLEYLFNLGRQTGDDWIAQNGEALGQRSTMDVQRLLPGRIGQYLSAGGPVSCCQRSCKSAT